MMKHLKSRGFINFSMAFQRCLWFHMSTSIIGDSVEQRVITGINCSAVHLSLCLSFPLLTEVNQHSPFIHFEQRARVIKQTHSRTVHPHCLSAIIWATHTNDGCNYPAVQPEQDEATIVAALSGNTSMWSETKRWFNLCVMESVRWGELSPIARPTHRCVWLYCSDIEFQFTRRGKVGEDVTGNGSKQTAIQIQRMCQRRCDRFDQMG